MECMLYGYVLPFCLHIYQFHHLYNLKASTDVMCSIVPSSLTSENLYIPAPSLILFFIRMPLKGTFFSVGQEP